MARQILILGKSITDANRYARLAGLPRFSYRSVRSAGSIRAVRNAEVHILPGFVRRPDRHSILGALRYAKSLEIYYVDPEDFIDHPDHVGSGDGPTPEEIEEAYAMNEVHDFVPRHATGLSDEEKAEIEAHLEPEGWEPPESLDAIQVLKLAAEPDRPAAEVLEEHDAASGTSEPVEEPAPEPVKPRKPRKPKAAKPAPAPAAPAADPGNFFAGA